LNTLFTISDNGHLYEVSVRGLTIVHVSKVCEDSQMYKEVDFDNLSERVKRKILNEITQETE
jgi:hypothetical protein